jgi:hypothetical protein
VAPSAEHTISRHRFAIAACLHPIGLLQYSPCKLNCFTPPKPERSATTTATPLKCQSFSVLQSYFTWSVWYGSNVFYFVISFAGTALRAFPVRDTALL